MVRVWMVVALVVALLSGSNLASAQDKLERGGEVVANGKPLQAPYYKRGPQMYFPIVPLCQGLNKSVNYNTATRVLTVDGRQFQPQALVIDNLIYVPFTDLNQVLAGVQYGMVQGKAHFVSSGTATVPPPPPNTPQATVTIVSHTIRFDTTRGERVVMDVTVHNQTNRAVNAALLLTLVDRNGIVSGSGRASTYSQYQELIGVLQPGEVKKVVLNTDVPRPRSYDPGRQTMELELTGFSVSGPTLVQIDYKIEVQGQ